MVNLRRAPRRPMQWYESIQGEEVREGATQDVDDLLSNIPTALRMGSTVTRIMVDINVHPVDLTLIYELYWGIAVIHADALAVVALPDPGTVDDIHWLIHSRLVGRSGNLSSKQGDDRALVDLRSQRVLRASTDRLVLVTTVQTTGNLDYSHFIRVLVKHP